MHFIITFEMSLVNVLNVLVFLLLTSEKKMEAIRFEFAIF